MPANDLKDYSQNLVRRLNLRANRQPNLTPEDRRQARAAAWQLNLMLQRSLGGLGKGLPTKATARLSPPNPNAVPDGLPVGGPRAKPAPMPVRQASSAAKLPRELKPV